MQQWQKQTINKECEMMVRPIFANEVLGANNGSFDPQYDVVSGGEVVAENAVLRLKNPVTTEGTPLNAANLNNMFDFDNFESMRGHRKTTTRTSTAVTETITPIGSNVVNARRVTTFPAADRIRVETTIFAANGGTVIRRTTVNTTVGATVTEEVS